VRVQDIAIGAGISVAVGALLWPRGARGVARRSFAELLRAGSHHLSVALDVALNDASGDLDLAAEGVADARARAVAALEDLALEHGGGHVDRQGWGSLLVEALLLELAAVGIVRVRPTADTTGCRDAIGVLQAEGAGVVASVDAEADRLVREGVRVLEPAPPHDDGAVPPEIAACLGAPSPQGLRVALDLVWVYEWLTLAAAHPV